MMATDRSHRINSLLHNADTLQRTGTFLIKLDISFRLLEQKVNNVASLVYRICNEIFQ